MFTHLDLHNARLYAAHRLLELKFEEYKISHPHLFGHVRFDSRPATDYYVPPAIAHLCRTNTLKFTEKGCRKISCYPYLRDGSDCDDDQHHQQKDVRVLRHGNGHTFACQPACFERDLPRIDVAYSSDGECVMQNYLLKKYAMEEGTSPAPHHGLDVHEDQLALNERYCAAYGVVLRDGDCVPTGAQAFGEFFVGTTVYRSLNVLTTQPQTPLSPPEIPPELASRQSWLEGHASPSVRRRNRRSAPANAAVDTLESIDWDEMAKELAIDAGIDVGAHLLASFLKKKLPQQLSKLPAMVGTITARRVASSAVLSAVTSSHVTVARAASVFAGKLLAGLSNVYGVFSIIVAIVDIVDPRGFNNVLSREDVEEVSVQLNAAFNESVGPEKAVTPPMIWDYLERDEEERHVDFAIDRVVEYLQALEVNAYGTRMERQQELHELRRREWLTGPISHVTYHLFVTSLFLLTGLVLLEHFVFVACGLLAFTLFYNSFVAHSVVLPVLG